MAEFEAPDIKDEKGFIQQLFVHKPVIHVKGFQTFNPLQMLTQELEVITIACFMLCPTILIIIKLSTII